MVLPEANAVTPEYFDAVPCITLRLHQAELPLSQPAADDEADYYERDRIRLWIVAG
ncbi:MAG: hypothetical protein JSV65_12455 [Armatimonadota bacterium]|nr:MAG: hypothetical protein JSV65_12455 [Armatimonadota bacterium]